VYTPASGWRACTGSCGARAAALVGGVSGCACGSARLFRARRVALLEVPLEKGGKSFLCALQRMLLLRVLLTLSVYFFP
jgi:hypothetical protein